MNYTSIEKIGKWIAILTFLFGAFLIAAYLINHDVEAGTLLYFYMLFAGITNFVALLLVIVSYFLIRENKKRALITSAFIIISYSVVLCISYFIF